MKNLNQSEIKTQVIIVGSKYELPLAYNNLDEEGKATFDKVMLMPIEFRQSRTTSPEGEVIPSPEELEWRKRVYGTIDTRGEAVPISCEPDWHQVVTHSNQVGLDAPCIGRFDWVFEVPDNVISSLSEMRPEAYVEVHIKDSGRISMWKGGKRIA